MQLIAGRHEIIAYTNDNNKPTMHLNVYKGKTKVRLKKFKRQFKTIKQQAVNKRDNDKLFRSGQYGGQKVCIRSYKNAILKRCVLNNDWDLDKSESSRVRGQQWSHSICSAWSCRDQLSTLKAL